MHKPNLYHALKDYLEFDEIIDNPTQKKGEAISILVKRSLEKWNSGPSSIKFKAHGSGLGDRSFERYFEICLPKHLKEKRNKKDQDTAPVEATKALINYVIITRFENLANDHKRPDFKDFYRVQHSILNHDDSVMSALKLEHLHGFWHIYINHEGALHRLPTKITFHDFNSPLGVELKYLDNSLLVGTLESGYVSKRNFPRKEAWIYVSNSEYSLSGRLHLSRKCLERPDLVVSGMCHFNYDINKREKERIFGSALILEKAEFSSFRDETSERVSWTHPNSKNDEDTNRIVTYLHRRRSIAASEIAPSTHDALKEQNLREKSDERRIENPLDQEQYRSMKAWFSGTWFSLSRFIKDGSELSFIQYDFHASDHRRNFTVRRSNHGGTSNMIGFTDRIGWDIYLVLRGKTNSRNCMITFTYPSRNTKKASTAPKLIQALGLSRAKDGSLIAWRELLIRFPEGSLKNAGFPFAEVNTSRISHEEFIGIHDKIIPPEQKLYLANIGQATLSFPTKEGSLLTQYERQKRSLEFCDKMYFVYCPYGYFKNRTCLFRIKLTIDKAAQVKLDVAYGNTGKLQTFQGWTSVVNNTLRISAFNPGRQHIQILANVPEFVSDGPIVLEGNMLSTDSKGFAVSDSCFIIEHFVLSERLVTLDKAAVIEIESPEVETLDSIIEIYLSDYFEFSGLKAHFDRFPSIAHHPKRKRP